MGRGHTIGLLPGNKNFRRTCWKYRAAYAAANRISKGTVAAAVLDEIASLTPPGRVLLEVSAGMYAQADRRRAIEKTSQLLREKKNKHPDLVVHTEPRKPYTPGGRPIFTVKAVSEDKEGGVDKQKKASTSSKKPASTKSTGEKAAKAKASSSKKKTFTKVKRVAVAKKKKSDESSRRRICIVVPDDCRYKTSGDDLKHQGADAKAVKKPAAIPTFVPSDISHPGHPGHPGQLGSPSSDLNYVHDILPFEVFSGDDELLEADDEDHETIWYTPGDFLRGLSGFSTSDDDEDDDDTGSLDADMEDCGFDDELQEIVDSTLPRAHSPNGEDVLPVCAVSHGFASMFDKELASSNGKSNTKRGSPNGVAEFFDQDDVKSFRSLGIFEDMDMDLFQDLSLCGIDDAALELIESKRRRTF